MFIIKTTVKKTTYLRKDNVGGLSINHVRPEWEEGGTQKTSQMITWGKGDMDDSHVYFFTLHEND